MSTYTMKNEDAIRSLLENLMTTGIVEGVMVQSSGKSGIFSSLVTDPEKIKNTAPLAPLFSQNNAVFLQNNGTRKIAVVAKPCEARSINELKKLHQVLADNVILISADCLGTYDPKETMISDHLTEKKIKELAKDSITVRNACTVCEHFIPPEVDIGIMSIGVKDGYLLETDRADLIEGLDLKEGNVPEKRDGEVQKKLKERNATKEKMVKHMVTQLSSPETLIEVLKHCIRCDNCRDMCPICYCKECYFETPLGHLRTDEMLHQAAIKGILRIPPDILFYHFTRGIHVAPSCVECGACEEACPRDIPLMAMWKSLTGEVQSIFEYVAGQKVDEALPLVRFKESELEEV